MPWSVSMTAREAFIFDVNDGMTPTEAAEEHGIDRSCAYKWLARYRELGWEGLQDLSRRPEHSPKRTPQNVIDALVALKTKHPDMGPAKLVPMLRREGHVLSVTTGGEILARLGMVVRRRPRHRSPGRIEHGPFEVAGAGDTMTADFKGQFRMGNGALCYPLTVADPFSRYVLAVAAKPSTHMQAAKESFERVFREYGVPRQMITDNGPPFCSANSLGGLTQLSLWWIEVGIIPIRIQPGRPDQNGIHERMHRTLKAWIRRNKRFSMRSQQKCFDAFRAEFNYVRPHQSLGQKTPSTAFRHYRPLLKPTIEYDTTFDVRRVNANGEIKLNGTAVFLSEVLIGGNVGLRQVGESLLSISFGPVQIGYLDQINFTVTNRRPDRDEEEE